MAVGIYLPLELSVPIFIGGLIAYLVERRLGIRGDSPQAERAKQNGILFAAGLITGEALMGIFIAIFGTNIGSHFLYCEEQSISPLPDPMEKCAPLNPCRHQPLMPS